MITTNNSLTINIKYTKVLVRIKIQTVAYR
nr:MAG TPA: hypothetical protein [Bacteriophage sp.]